MGRVQLCAVVASYGGRPVNDGMVKRWHAPSCVPPLPVAGMVIDASGRWACRSVRRVVNSHIRGLVTAGRTVSAGVDRKSM